MRVSDRHRGWISSGGAKMDDDAKPDRKESFLWGYQDAQGMTVEDHPLRGANQWPEFLPQLENHAMEWFQHSHRLAAELMAGFAIGLGLKDDFFLRKTERPLSRCSLVYYPDQPLNWAKTSSVLAPIPILVCSPFSAKTMSAACKCKMSMVTGSKPRLSKAV